MRLIVEDLPNDPHDARGLDRAIAKTYVRFWVRLLARHVTTAIHDDDIAIWEFWSKLSMSASTWDPDPSGMCGWDVRPPVDIASEIEAGLVTGGRVLSIDPMLNRALIAVNGRRRLYRLRYRASARTTETFWMDCGPVGTRRTDKTFVDYLSGEVGPVFQFARGVNAPLRDGEWLRTFARFEYDRTQLEKWVSENKGKFDTAKSEEDFFTGRVEALTTLRLLETMQSSFPDHVDMDRSGVVDGSKFSALVCLKPYPPAEPTPKTDADDSGRVKEPLSPVRVEVDTNVLSEALLNYAAKDSVETTAYADAVRTVVRTLVGEPQQQLADLAAATGKDTIAVKLAAEMASRIVWGSQVSFFDHVRARSAAHTAGLTVAQAYPTPVYARTDEHSPLAPVTAPVDAKADTDRPKATYEGDTDEFGYKDMNVERTVKENVVQDAGLFPYGQSTKADLLDLHNLNASNKAGRELSFLSEEERAYAEGSPAHDPIDRTPTTELPLFTGTWPTYTDEALNKSFSQLKDEAYRTLRDGMESGELAVTIADTKTTQEAPVSKHAHTAYASYGRVLAAADGVSLGLITTENAARVEEFVILGAPIAVAAEMAVAVSHAEGFAKGWLSYFQSPAKGVAILRWLRENDKRSVSQGGYTLRLYQHTGGSKPKRWIVVEDEVQENSMVCLTFLSALRLLHDSQKEGTNGDFSFGIEDDWSEPELKPMAEPAEPKKVENQGTREDLVKDIEAAHKQFHSGRCVSLSDMTIRAVMAGQIPLPVHIGSKELADKYPGYIEAQRGSWWVKPLRGYEALKEKYVPRATIYVPISGRSALDMAMGRDPAFVKTIELWMSDEKEGHNRALYVRIVEGTDVVIYRERNGEHIICRGTPPFAYEGQILRTYTLTNALARIALMALSKDTTFSLSVQPGDIDKLFVTAGYSSEDSKKLKCAMSALNTVDLTMKGNVATELNEKYARFEPLPVEPPPPPGAPWTSFSEDQMQDLAKVDYPAMRERCQKFIDAILPGHNKARALKSWVAAGAESINMPHRRTRLQRIEFIRGGILAGARLEQLGVSLSCTADPSTISTTYLVRGPGEAATYLVADHMEAALEEMAKRVMAEARRTLGSMMTGTAPTYVRDDEIAEEAAVMAARADEPKDSPDGFRRAVAREVNNILSLSVSDRWAYGASLLVRQEAWKQTKEERTKLVGEHIRRRKLAQAARGRTTRVLLADWLRNNTWKWGVGEESASSFIGEVMSGGMGLEIRSEHRDYFVRAFSSVIAKQRDGLIYILAPEESVKAHPCTTNNAARRKAHGRAAEPAPATEGVHTTATGQTLAGKGKSK